jgi:drug/metabolite transporter (DMT)-like permease
MVFVCFCAGAAMQTLAMRRSEISVNYILVLGLEAALALVLGVAWLGEAVSPLKLAGVALIVVGVAALRSTEGPEVPAQTPGSVGAPAPVRLAPCAAAPRSEPGC